MLQVNASILRIEIAAVLTAFLVCCAASAQPFRRVALPTQGMLPMTNIHCLLQDSDGLMWYGTPGEGICRDNGYQVDVFRLPEVDGADYAATNSVLSMAECRRKDELWVATRNGLFALSKRSFSFRTVNPQLFRRRTSSVVAAADGTMWVAAVDSFYHLDASGQMLSRHRSTRHGRRAMATHTYIDPQGQPWFMQWGGGLMRLAGDSLQEVDWPFAESPVTMVASPNAADTYYIGTWDGGVVGMIFRQGQAIYAPLHHFDHLSDTQRQIIDLKVDTRRQWLWCATMSGLEALDLSGEHPMGLDLTGLNLPRNAVIDQLCLTSQGHVFVSGFSPSTFIILSDAESRLSGRKIEGDVGLRVAVSGDSAWVQAERVGLQFYSLKDGRQLPLPGEPDQPFADREWQPTNTCRDARGHLWTQTNNHVTEKSPKTGVCRVFSIADGTLPMEYCTDMVPLADGGVCVTGARGLLLLPHASVLDTLQAPVRAAVTAYITDGDTTLCSPAVVPHVSLSARFNQLTLLLTSFDPVHTAAVTFAWQLSTDTVWHELPVGHNELTLYDLPLGQQKLRVRVTDGYGRWGESHEVATLNRAPKWHETWLFRLAVIITVLLIPYLYMQSRKRHKREMEELRQQFVRQIEAMQKDMLPPTVSDEIVEDTQTEKKKEAEKETEQPKLSVLDQEFIDKSIQSVNKHMDDDHFTVDQFADELCMSRMNLYRWMRSTTGMSPSDFIKNQRLEHAAQLLLTTSHSIVQIADLCGFSTPSYFTKCFKEKFGITPKEGRK